MAQDKLILESTQYRDNNNYTLNYGYWNEDTHRFDRPEDELDYYWFPGYILPWDQELNY